MQCFSLLCGLTSSLIFGLGWLLQPASVRADVVPDRSLPQPSKVTPAGRRAVITDGTRRGRNLFHSFREFSVTPGGAAAFAADPAIANIFARVTGSNPSRINGLIEVLDAQGQISTANLFLLNPNGILFGRNAELRLGGSFVASTADRLNFADGRSFPARPQAASLLTVSVPVGLQFGHSPGPIVNRSVQPRLDEAGNPQLDASGNEILGLVGRSDQTLALVGGDVTLAGRSSIRSDGGRIELGSVKGAGQVALRPVAQGWDLSYEQAEALGDLRLLNQAQIDSSGAAGGEVQLQGRRIILQDFSYIFSDSDPDSARPGGNLRIAATDSVRVERNSLLTTSTGSSRQAGNILIDTPQLIVQSGGQIGSITYAQGRGGDIQINAESVTASGLSLIGLSPEAFRQRYQRSPLSLIYAQSSSDGAGRAGNIQVETQQLTVQNGAQISTTTFGPGTAGNLSIRANQVELREIAVAPNGQLLRSADGIPRSGGLFVGTGVGSSGRGGNLQVETDYLSLRDGAILQATTYGSGDAGNVSVEAQAIEVSGSSATGSLPARIAATSGGVPGLTTAESRRATGRGGNLRLNTNQLSISDQGIITVNSASRDSPGAGTIQITASQMQLDRQGQLAAQTESGNRARIRLDDIDLLTLRGNSRISTTAGLRSDGGDAGNIRINADVILSAPAEDSDIDADARAGRGGNIIIQAQGILGITERRQRSLQSDITATSESNVDGEISISTASFDPTQGLVALPDTVVDASQLIAQGCQAVSPSIRQAGRPPTQSEFVITGRGGLPPNPTDLQSNSTVMPRWVSAAPGALPGSAQQSARQSARLEQPAPDNRALAAPVIAEAQGWIRTAAGTIALVAEAPTLTPNAAGWALHCPER